MSCRGHGITYIMRPQGTLQIARSKKNGGGVPPAGEGPLIFAQWEYFSAPAESDWGQLWGLCNKPPQVAARPGTFLAFVSAVIHDAACLSSRLPLSKALRAHARTHTPAILIAGNVYQIDTLGIVLSGK